MAYRPLKSSKSRFLGSWGCTPGICCAHPLLQTRRAMAEGWNSFVLNTLNAHAWRNDNLIIRSKRHHDVVFGVMMTLFLRHVSVGIVVTADVLLGVKPLSEPMLIWHINCSPKNKFQWNFSGSKYDDFHSIKCIWKCRLRNKGHFVSVSLC